jgi:hypothetical protein
MGVAFSFTPYDQEVGIIIALLIISLKSISTFFPGFFGAFLSLREKAESDERGLKREGSNVAELPECVVSSKMKGATDSVFIQVVNGIYLALYDAQDAERMAQHKLFGKRTIIPLLGRNLSSTDPGFTPNCLAEIFRFDEMMRAVQRQNPTHSIVLCTGADIKVQTKAVFLAGCHMIMTQGFSYAHTLTALANTTNSLASEITDAEGLTVPCCWMAVSRAKALGWIDFGDVFDTGCDNPSRIFIEEYIHYAK